MDYFFGGRSLEEAHWKSDHRQTLAGNSTSGGVSVSAVNHLQYLDSRAATALE